MSEHRPTILQIIPQLDTGGAELSTIETTEAIVRAGGRAIVLSEGGRLAPEIARHGGEWIAFPAATKNPARMLANARRIAALVERERVDLVHARSRAPAWSALMAARRAKRPFVTTYHGAYKSGGRLKNAYNSVMARGDIVVANSDFTAKLIAAEHHVPRARLRVIHRGVDTVRFDPEAISDTRKAALRAAWGVAPDRQIILHAARLTAWKGQRVVIEAAARLAAAGVLGDAVVVLAGDDQGRDGYAEDLRRRVDRAALKDRVLLVGHCADIAAAYALAYVTVVPSIEPEAFGRSVAEALAVGCPVIASDIGAPPEILARSGNTPPEAPVGWLVPPGDAGALADRIAQVFAASSATRAAVAVAARAHAVGHFSSEAMKRAKLAIYDDLLGTDLRSRFDFAHRDAAHRAREPGSQADGD